MTQIDGVKTIQDLWAAVDKTRQFIKVRVDRATLKTDPTSEVEVGYGCGAVRVRIKSGPIGIYDIYNIDLDDQDRHDRHMAQAIKAIQVLADQGEAR